MLLLNNSVKYYLLQFVSLISSRSDTSCYSHVLVVCTITEKFYSLDTFFLLCRRYALSSVVIYYEIWMGWSVHIYEEITQQKPVHCEGCAHQERGEGQVEGHELHALGADHQTLNNHDEALKNQ